MKKNLLLSGTLCALLFNMYSAEAQVKGDPPVSGSVEATGVQKITSRISADLKKLSDNNGVRAKVAQSAKPVPVVEDGLSQYLQIKGDKVVIDVTAKGDVAATKSALQKMGFEVRATYGRVISGLMPIANLSQLESSSTIQFAKPAYKPLHQR
jgi:hypothetical protein